MHLPDTWNHEQHEGRGRDHPSNISGLTNVLVARRLNLDSTAKHTS